MNIFIVSVCVFTALIVTAHCLDMCKTRAEIEITHLLCRFLVIEYLEEHPEEEEFFRKILSSEVE